MYTGVPGRNAAAADTVHPYKFEYDVMLDRYEEVYHHVVGDPLKAMPPR